MRTSFLNSGSFSLNAARIASLMAALLAACTHMPPAQPPLAVVDLHPTMGNAVSGHLSFIQRGDVVVLEGDVQGLAPNTEHGFHIHVKGDCSSPDGSSAGGHFNPDGHHHGASSSAADQHHTGDLPSLQADGMGVAHLSVVLHDVSFGTGAHDILGRALIVHRDRDDFVSQPAGNSGPRLACGVVQRP